MTIASSPSRMAALAGFARSAAGGSRRDAAWRALDYARRDAAEIDPAIRAFAAALRPEIGVPSGGRYDVGLVAAAVMTIPPSQRPAGLSGVRRDKATGRLVPVYSRDVYPVARSVLGALLAMDEVRRRRIEARSM